MKHLLTDNKTGESFIEEDGVRTPISPQEVRKIVMENCGTRGELSWRGQFKRLELLTMEEFLARNPEVR